MQRKKSLACKKAMGRFVKCCIALVLVLTLSVAAPWGGMSPTASAASLTDLQNKQKQLEQQQKANKAKLSQLKNDKAKQQEYMDTLTAQINNLSEQISGLTQQISTLDGEIIAKTAEIADKQTDINQNTELLKKRLCALYMTGEASTLEIMLNSKSVLDLADKMEVMKAITEHDTKMIQNLKAEMDSIAEQKKEIEQSRQQVTDAKTQLDSKKAEVNKLEQEAEQVMADINKNVNSASAESQKIAKDLKAADAAIDKWLKDYAESQKNNSGGYTSTGNFTWPCPGFTKLTTNFREVIFGAAHRGIDVAGSGIAGAKIVAADSGKVIKAGWDSSYGNCVFIDHGGGFITRYAHCSKLAVSQGQTVTKGQVIGYVGKTGFVTGYHLHFEVIKNGALQNPMSYFK